MKPKLLVTRKLPEAVEDRLAASYNVTFNLSDRPMNLAELTGAMSQFDAIAPTVSDKLTADILRTPDRRVKMIRHAAAAYRVSNIRSAHGDGNAGGG